MTPGLLVELANPRKPNGAYRIDGEGGPVAEYLPPNVRQIRLADAVKHLRGKRDLSARSLSLQAGLSSSYVGKLEAGEIEPSVRAFARLAMVLGMSVQEVFFCVIQEGLLITGPSQQDECHTEAVVSVP